MLWPRLLGGVDRPYVQITALASLPGLDKLAELAEEDCFEIAVDSSWSMEEALRVCLNFLLIYFLKNWEREILKWDRRMAGC